MDNSSIKLQLFFFCLVLPVSYVSMSGNDSPVLNPLQIRPNLSISDRVLPIQIVDSIDSSVRFPQRKQLRSPVLLATLGTDFDSSWMAIDKPKLDVEHGQQPTFSRKLVSEMRELNLSRELSTVLGDDDYEEDLPLDLVERFEKWLLRKASCPVRYVWDDVGPLFWPRWIKRGECVNVVGSRACSWPSGMHCVPAESLTVHLLRWHCRPRPSSSGAAAKHKPKHRRKLTLRRAQNKYRCQWLKVPYPVTSQCHCSC